MTFQRKVSFLLKLVAIPLIALLIYNAITLSTSAQNKRNLSCLTDDPNSPNKTENSAEIVPQLKFNNTELAFKVLIQLDNFTGYNTISQKRKIFTPYLNLTNDDEYCIKRTAYFVEHPESVFEELNVVSDSPNDSMVKVKVVSPIGRELIEKENKTAKDVPLEATVFFTRHTIHVTKDVGRHFSCLSQAQNRIPGDIILGSKNTVAKAIIDYSQRFISKPECFNYEKFFPQTWLLYEKESCLDFFNIFNLPQYEELKKERRIVYMRKIGSRVHMGEGVQPVNEEEEADLRAIYQNGVNCGQVDKNYIIQTYIHNPLLLDGHKFDFRMYMFIASTNPLIVYYHDGFLRVSLMPYDNRSNDKKVLLTNLALSKQIYDDAKEGKLFEGMDEENLKHAQQWSFERLQAYLLEKSIISDPNWLDNYLRPEFKKAMVYLARLTAHTLLQDSSVYKIYGPDFMLDSNLNLWFIEANPSPGIGGYSEEVEKIIVKMLQDHFEIVIGLVRSRMKRVVEYVNKIIEEGGVEEIEEGKVVVKGVEEKRDVFRNITRNYFEKEYEPSAGNGFSKIIDGNYEGAEMYLGFIKEECI